MVEFLLENGANSNTCDKQERRPLHWASYVGYNEIIKLLLKHGADINCLDKEVNILYLDLNRNYKFMLFYFKVIYANISSSC